MIEKDSMTYWYFLYHKDLNYNRLYARHKPKDHNEVMARRRQGRKNRRSKRDLEDKLPVAKGDIAKLQQRKLVLLKEMKTALLTVGVFTEEQANVIVHETQANLPKDF